MGSQPHTYELQALRKDGSHILSTTITIDPLTQTQRELLVFQDAAEQAFLMIPGCTTVSTFNQDGMFVCAHHHVEGRRPVVSTVYAWWEPTAGAVTGPELAYATRKRLHAWLAPLLAREAARDRLEAALKAL